MTKAGPLRQKKQTLFVQLEELLADNLAFDKDTPLVWEKHGYRFKFLWRDFFWNEERIHITAGEALYLYQRLVLNEEADKKQRFYMRNMRRRLGKAFLSEVCA